MTRFKIDIVSDTICPWCYVGAKRLDEAIAAYKAKHPESDDTFETTWLPYYLNPDGPKVGVDKREMMAKKFGPEQAQMITQRLANVGKEAGIDFKFGGKTGNTKNSHRLIALAREKSPETQTRLVRALFGAYFENEQDITSSEVLSNAAVKAGLDESEVTKVLESDRFGDEVDDEVARARQSLVSGVPHFTIQDKFEVNGAQEPAAFTYMFERIKQLESVSKA